METRARLVHKAGCRVRLAVPDRRGQRDFFEALGQQLIASDKLSSYAANPFTGTFVLVSTQPWCQAVEEEVAQLGRLVITQPNSHDLYDPTKDMPIDQLTRELPVLGAMSLFALASRQAQRGKFLPAGLTLIFQGWSMFRDRSKSPDSYMG